MRRTRSAIPIAFDDHGQGEPALLCLPGWCVERTINQELVQACSRHRRTLALDWRGHGQSAAHPGDFGEEGMVEDALAVIEESGAERIVLIAVSHSGWAGLELRRRLGKRIPALVLVDWLLLDPSPRYAEVLAALQDRDRWQASRTQLFDLWLHGVDNERICRFVREDMGAYGFDMWARAARTISAAYRRDGNPLRALAALRPPVPALHLYAQPADAAFLAAQEQFAASHPWFSVRRVNATSHFPMVEAPEEMADAIESFLAGLSTTDEH